MFPHNISPTMITKPEYILNSYSRYGIISYCSDMLYAEFM